MSPDRAVRDGTHVAGDAGLVEPRVPDADPGRTDAAVAGRAGLVDAGVADADAGCTDIGDRTASDGAHVAGDAGLVEPRVPGRRRGG
jgi:hypothetical protein